jgi:hypothetical protein
MPGIVEIRKHKALARAVSMLFLFASCIPRLQAQNPADSVSAEEKSYWHGLYLRRDFCEALSLTYDYRPAEKRSYEIAAGVKGPMGLFSALFIALDRGLWTQMYGPRIAFTYKRYFGASSKAYYGPSADLAYLWFDGSYHACSRCGLSASVFYQRTDLAFKILLGRKGPLGDINIGLGIRGYYGDLKLKSGTATSEVIGKPIYTMRSSPVMSPNGLHIKPAVQISVALGGIRKK